MYQRFQKRTGNWIHPWRHRHRRRKQKHRGRWKQEQRGLNEGWIFWTAWELEDWDIPTSNSYTRFKGNISTFDGGLSQVYSPVSSFHKFYLRFPVIRSHTEEEPLGSFIILSSLSRLLNGLDSPWSNILTCTQEHKKRAFKWPSVFWSKSSVFPCF